MITADASCNRIMTGDNLVMIFVCLFVFTAKAF